MLAMGVIERCPLPIGFVNETPSTHIGSQVLAEAKIRLGVPVGVLVDLTALAMVQ